MIVDRLQKSQWFFYLIWTDWLESLLRVNTNETCSRVTFRLVTKVVLYFTHESALQYWRVSSSVSRVKNWVLRMRYNVFGTEVFYTAEYLRMFRSMWFGCLPQSFLLHVQFFGVLKWQSCFIASIILHRKEWHCFTLILKSCTYAKTCMN